MPEHDRVPVEGCDVTNLNLDPEELFFRAFRYAEFDVAELSLSSYILQHQRGVGAYLAIPVFPSRMFRHSGFYIRTDRGIESPADLDAMHDLHASAGYRLHLTRTLVGRALHRALARASGDNNAQA